MSRPLALINKQIELIEAQLCEADSLIEQAGSDGTMAKRVDYETLNDQLRRLYLERDRASGAPMFARTRVTGLRR